MNSEALILAKISDSFPNAEINILDRNQDGQYVALQIISEKFSDKTRIERSRMVYSLLQDLLDSGKIHSLQLNLKTPQENGSAA